MRCFGGYSWYAHLDGRGRATAPAVPADGIVSFQNFGMALADRLAALDAMPQARARLGLALLCP